ncbi:MAG: hypothetical protein AAGF72_16220, partial [Pseudomonadota bacterium]
RRLGCGLSAAVVGALAFAVSGWMAAHAKNVPLVCVVCWFPLGLTGLEAALTQGNYDTSGTATVTKTITDNEKVSAEILYETTTSVPDKAFSLGLGTGISAYHFVATSTAESRRLPGSQTERDSTATHTQAFYIVGPSDSTL